MSLEIGWDQIHIGIPNDVMIGQPYTYLIYAWILVIAFTLVLKLYGKAPHMKAGIICAVSLLCMEVVCAFIYYYKVPFLDELLKPLPFLDVQDNTVRLAAYEFYADGTLNAVKFFDEVMALYVLTFLVNQVYDYQQGNLKPLGWLAFRLISTMLCIVLHFAFSKAMEKFVGWYTAHEFSENLLHCIPLFILGGLAVTFVLGLIKKIIAKFFRMVHFTFDGLNNFYFTKKFGTMLTRSIYSTILLTAFAVLLQRTCEVNGILPVFTLGTYSLGVSLTLIGLLVLWILVGFIL